MKAIAIAAARVALPGCSALEQDHQVVLVDWIDDDDVHAATIRDCVEDIPLCV